MTDSGFRTVARTGDIPANSNKAFNVDGHDVLICHTRAGEFFAVENRCSHAIAELEGGRMRGTRLICPLHGAAFDIRDGSVKGAPAYEPIRTYDIEVDGEDIRVRVNG